MLTPLDQLHLRAFGFVVLRGAFDARPLTDEVDRALRDGCRSAFSTSVGGAALVARYVPMMCEETPVSASHLAGFARIASTLLGAPVIPTRAKGVLYDGETAWHRDSEHPVTSIGMAAYLEPMRTDTAALRVVPGSHRAELGGELETYLAAARDHGPASPPQVALETDPGDVIVFDEHLWHASPGGMRRRQWRVDYLADPKGAGSEHDARLRAYFADIFPPDFDGGYDVDRFPSYGPAWRSRGDAFSRRLGELGIYQLAGAQEAFTRAQRPCP